MFWELKSLGKSACCIDLQVIHLHSKYCEIETVRLCAHNYTIHRWAQRGGHSCWGEEENIGDTRRAKPVGPLQQGTPKMSSDHDVGHTRTEHNGEQMDSCLRVLSQIHAHCTDMFWFLSYLYIIWYVLIMWSMCSRADSGIPCGHIENSALGNSKKRVLWSGWLYGLCFVILFRTFFLQF